MAQTWKIVGGAGKGGILVREGRDTSSAEQSQRLSTGAVVEEVELCGDRLHYRLLQGDGPGEGWVSAQLKGKDLAVRIAIDSSTAKEQSPDVSAPVQLASVTPVKPLPPWKRPQPKPGQTFGQLIKEVAAGEFYGLEFPVTVPMLGESNWGPPWLTQAFHAAGTLPKNNEVASIRSLQEVPMNSVDIAGGAARKGLLTVAYAQEDPDLHTDLFVKVPFQEEDNVAMRQNLSCFGDPDGAEVSALQFLLPMLPFRTPKTYFSDISRKTSNFITITERIMFAKKGDELKPFQIHPAIGKFGDFELKDPIGPYYALFKTMARMVAIDKTGGFDSIKEIFEETSYARFGGREKYLADQQAQKDPGQIAKEKQVAAKRNKAKVDRRLKSLQEEIEGLKVFILEIAPWLFPDDCKEEPFLKDLMSQFELVIRHSDAIITYCTEHPTLRGFIHPNPEVDNAFFWQDTKGEYECGLFDWGGAGYQPFSRLFLGTIRSALPEVYLAHEKRWFQCFSEEVQKHGGPEYDPRDCLEISRLMFVVGMIDIAGGIKTSLLSTTVEEWKTIKEKTDARIVGHWGVKTAVLRGLNHLTIWRRGDHWQFFLDFCKRQGWKTEPPFE